MYSLQSTVFHPKISKKSQRTRKKKWLNYCVIALLVFDMVKCACACMILCGFITKTPHSGIEHELKLIVFAFNRQESLWRLFRTQ